MAWSLTDDCEREYPELVGFFREMYKGHGEVLAGVTEHCNRLTRMPNIKGKPCTIYLDRNGSTNELACAFQWVSKTDGETATYKQALIYSSALKIEGIEPLILLTYDMKKGKRKDKYADLIPFP